MNKSTRSTIDGGTFVVYSEPDRRDVSSFAFSVTLYMGDGVRLDMSTDEARLLGLALIRAADRSDEEMD